MRCPACNARVGDDATVCGQCGRKLRDDDAKKTMMGIPAMDADDPGQDDEPEEASARSTLFGIPAASRGEGAEDEPPKGPGGRDVRDDSTPVPENYQGDGDARTQVADSDTLTNALRDSGPQKKQDARSTQFGLPQADKDADGDDDGDDIASQWGLGEESDDAESKTMVASANLLDQATGSDVAGEGTGYSKPQAEVDPNVQTLHGMMGDEGESNQEQADTQYEEYDEYGEADDSTQALSAEELEQFERHIMEEDGFSGRADEQPEQPSQPEPQQPPPAEPEPDDDSKRRRNLLQKLKSRSENDGGDDPRRTAAGIPAAQEGDGDSRGHDTIDERGGTGPRFSIPTAAGSQTEDQGDAEQDEPERGRNQTPRSGVLRTQKPKGKNDHGERGMLESSSSYRIAGSGESELEPSESSEPEQPSAAESPPTEPVAGPNTSFPISDSQSSSEPSADDSSDATAMLGDDQLAELSLDDTATLDEDDALPFEEPQQEDIDDTALAETSVAEPDAMPGVFDESRSAAPDEFGGSPTSSNTSGVIQPGESGSGVQQPAGSTSGVVQPPRSSGVIQPGESSGVVQPGEADDLQAPEHGGSGVIQPEPTQSGGSGVTQPDSSGIEQPARGTQRGGFGAESMDSGAREPAPPEPGVDARDQTPDQQEDSAFDFGATPAGAPHDVGSAAQQQGSAGGGFGSDQVPNPSQQAGTQSNQQRPTQPPDQREDEASSLERKIRVVFAVIGALVMLGAGGAAFAAGVIELPTVEKGIFLSPIAIGLVTLGVGLLPLSRGIKTVGLVLASLLAGAALVGAFLFEASAVVMLLLVGGTLLTLCSAAFPALVKLVK